MSNETVDVVVINWIAHRLGGWEPSPNAQSIPKQVYVDLSGVLDDDGKMWYFLDKPKGARASKPKSKSQPEGSIKVEK